MTTSSLGQIIYSFIEDQLKPKKAFAHFRSKATATRCGCSCSSPDAMPGLDHPPLACGSYL